MITSTFLSLFEHCAQTCTALYHRSYTHQLCNSHNIPSTGSWKRLLGSFKKVIKPLYRTQEKYELQYSRLKILLQLMCTISPSQRTHIYLLPLFLPSAINGFTVSSIMPLWGRNPQQSHPNINFMHTLQPSIVWKIKNFIHIGVWRKLKGFISNNKITERWKNLLIFLSVAIHVNDLVK